MGGRRVFQHGLQQPLALGARRLLVRGACVDDDEALAVWATVDLATLNRKDAGVDVLILVPNQELGLEVVQDGLAELEALLVGVVACAKAGPVGRGRRSRWCNAADEGGRERRGAAGWASAPRAATGLMPRVKAYRTVLRVLSSAAFGGFGRAPPRVALFLRGSGLRMPSHGERSEDSRRTVKRRRRSGLMAPQRRAVGQPIQSSDQWKPSVICSAGRARVVSRQRRPRTKGGLFLAPDSDSPG